MVTPVINCARGFARGLGVEWVAVDSSLNVAVLLFFFCPLVVCQTAPKPPDCTTLKYLRHKVACLCGTVRVCSGDICGRPSNYDLDDDIKVELRDRAGATTLDARTVGIETRERMCTTQAGTRVSCNTTERTFCFEGKRDGKYQLAFILFKNGTPQPAVRFPTNYSRNSGKSCNPVYMVEPSCPR